MIPLSKIHEGCVVEAKPLRDKSAIQRRKIVKVWEDANSYEFKYHWSHHIGESFVDSDGFTFQNYRDATSDWAVSEVLARYDKPLNFWREIKIAAIRIVHLVLARIEFNLKN